MADGDPVDHHLGLDGGETEMSNGGVYPELERAIARSHQRRYAIAAEAGLRTEDRKAETNGHVAPPPEPSVPYGLPGLAGRVSVTVQEFALLTGLSVPVIRKLIAQEELRAVQLGNAKPMIPMTEVDKFR
jgi:excisionase family DNA binding protein